MELLGFLAFSGDLQEYQLQHGTEPFMARDICVCTFVPSVKDGQLQPYCRTMALRLTGRTAKSFAIETGRLVAIEYSSSARTYSDTEHRWMRVGGNLNVSRIVEITKEEIEAVAQMADGMKAMAESK